ncbi:MAG: biotin/lipoyl-containing protein, partial [Bacteroidales bacterium]
MATFELKMPKLGESITEATITKWLKNTGDKIELDDPVVELSTDKVDSEIPSPVEGVLKEQLFNEGDTVEVDTVIAIIEVEGEEEDDSASQKEEDPDSGKEKEADSKSGKKSQSTEAEKTEDEGKEPKSEDEGKEEKPEETESTRFYSPLVRNIAKEEQISMEE